MASVEIDYQDIQIADSILRLIVYQRGKTNPFLIRLHGDEKEARQTGRWWVENNGGIFVDVDNKQREGEFNFNGMLIKFDPNRTFSKAGIKKTLEECESPCDSAVVAEIEKYAQALLEYCKKSPCIIALHNNQDFNINYYKKGGENYDPAIRIHINPNENPNNLVIVTEEADFIYLQKHDTNVVLECSDSQDHSGSLSKYCKREKIRYFNIETQHGELEPQKASLQLILKIVNNRHCLNLSS